MRGVIPNRADRLYRKGDTAGLIAELRRSAPARTTRYRRHVVAALGASDGPGIDEALVPIANDHSDSRRRDALAALALRATPAAEEALLRSSADPSSKVRWVVANGLRHFQTARARDCLTKLSSDTDLAVARRAIRSLADGGAPSVGRLLRIVHDESPPRSYTAARELGRMNAREARSVLAEDVEAARRFDQAFEATHCKMPGLRAALARILYRVSR